MSGDERSREEPARGGPVGAASLAAARLEGRPRRDERSREEPARGGPVGAASLAAATGPQGRERPRIGPRGPRAVLVGLPGSGKTTTGSRLARRLGVPFTDTDDLVEQRAGRSIRDIFATDGEAAFRKLEAEAVAAALESFDGVVALGGGAVTTPAVRDALAASGVPVVLLRTGLRTLARRVGDGGSRPLLAGDPRGRLAGLSAAREPLYRAVATLTVGTERRSPARVAEVIAGLLPAGADR